MNISVAGRLLLCYPLVESTRLESVSMQSPDAVPCDADATRTAVKDILDCYAVKVASKALARHLLPASGLANPSARRIGSRTRRLGSQTAAFPSHRAIPALVPATVVEPPEHIRYAAGVVAWSTLLRSTARTSRRTCSWLSQK